jgi:hypothetical protein
VFGKGYGHSAGIIGIDLLSEGIGNLIGLILTVMMLNAVYRHQTEPGRTYNPESRYYTLAMHSAGEGLISTDCLLHFQGLYS